MFTSFNSQDEVEQLNISLQSPDRDYLPKKKENYKTNKQGNTKTNKKDN